MWTVMLKKILLDNIRSESLNLGGLTLVFALAIYIYIYLRAPVSAHQPISTCQAENSILEDPITLSQFSSPSRAGEDKNI